MITSPKLILTADKGETGTDVANETSNFDGPNTMELPASTSPLPSHSPLIMRAFLKALDPSAERFTFQLFRDPKSRKNEQNLPGLPLIHHCNSDDAFALAQKWNTPQHGFGLYVTISETDLLGRQRKNITRARAVYIDVDEELDRVITALQGGLKPSAVVQTSRCRAQIYWWVNTDFPLDQFESVQAELISRFGTDRQVRDPTRVMRLPGSLHIKGDPQLVKLRLGTPTRFSLDEIVRGLKLTPFGTPTMPISKRAAALPPLPPLLGRSELSAGIAQPTFDFEKARSAGRALAQSGKLDDRDGWLNLWLFPLTHEAQQHPEIEHELKSLHDEVAALSAGFAAARGVRGTEGWAAENDSQWTTAMQRSPANPRRMGSVYAVATAEGWKLPATQRLNEGAASTSTPHTTVGQPAIASYADPYSQFVGPKFPTAILPAALADFVAAEHNSMGADLSALALASLAAVGAALTSETKVQVGDGWYERPILWVAAVGDPSTMKSPVIAAVTQPLLKIDNAENAAWRAKKAAYDQQKAAGSPATYPAKPARCIIQDATPEKTAEILARGPAGSMMVQDELAGWIAGFDRYGSGGSSRAFYLSAFNGGTYLKDRVGQGARDDNAEIRVENLALSILGGIQPDRLAGLRDLTSDGLLQRFLVVLMTPALRGNQKHPVKADEATFANLLERIHAMPRAIYRFAADAEPVLDRVLDRLHELEQVDGFSSALIGAVGKYRGYYARLALVLQVAREQSAILKNEPMQSAGIISRMTAEHSEQVLFQFLLPHTFGLHDVVANGGQDRDTIRAIGDFILATDKSRLRPSDFTAGVRRLRSQPANKITEWASRFVALGWLHPEEGSSINPKAWLVDPGLRAHFAARRQQAQTARTAAHEILKAGGNRR
ncbi:DUF3987 domain-containing protein [Bradyrhizobium sp. 613_E4_N2_2]|uniref:DUF3987 domain-containing protein n=1 Tax=Bradyrhizobium sp. 613_E4_N2_2 TaxID=3240371 RepID=UPI003F889CEB